MNEYHKKLEAESAGKAYQIPAEKRHDDFVSFVNDVWFPLQVRDGKHILKLPVFNNVYLFNQDSRLLC